MLLIKGLIVAVCDATMPGAAGTAGYKKQKASAPGGGLSLYSTY
jgi:hypothetical protein